MCRLVRTGKLVRSVRGSEAKLCEHESENNPLKAGENPLEDSYSFFFFLFLFSAYGWLCFSHGFEGCWLTFSGKCIC